MYLEYLVEFIPYSPNKDAALAYCIGQLSEFSCTQTASELLGLAERYRKPLLRAVPDIQSVLFKAIDNCLIYRCSHCGFTGQEMHWLCPSCKSWSTIEKVIK